MVAHLATTPIDRIAGVWEAPAAIVVAATLACALFTQAFVRLRARGRRDLAPWTRVPLFAAGLVLSVLPLISPLDAAGDSYLLSAHMLQHVLIGDAGPLLIVLAVRGPLVFFLLPGSVLKRVANVRPLRRGLALLLQPRVAFALWVGVILGWHVPSAYDAALGNGNVHAVEHISFVVVGTLAWTLLIDPARHRRLTDRGRIAFAIALVIASQPIVVALVSAPRPLYAAYGDQLDRLFGWSPIFDQRVAAAVMMVEQLLTLGVFVVVMLRPLLRRTTAAPAQI